MQRSLCHFCLITEATTKRLLYKIGVLKILSGSLKKYVTEFVS